MTVRWRVYYDDGFTFSNEDGVPEQAPAFGVICIVSIDDLVGRVILHRRDWYYWSPKTEGWWGGDIHGLLDRLLHRIPTDAVCQGRTISDEAYRDIMAAADRDPDLPPKSGRLAREYG